MVKNNQNSNGKVVTAAAILGAASLVSRIIGLVRERVLTTTFGAGDIFDAFVAAFRIPDLIFNLVVLGALSAAFIPLFTDKMVNGKKGDDNAHAFALSVLNTVLVLVGVLSLLYVWKAQLFVPLIAPGFEGEKLELTIRLSRVMAMQPVLLAISFVLSGILNSYKRFVAYAMAPIFYNVGIICGVVFLVPKMGTIGLAWGVVLGAALHLLVQLPSAMAVGFNWRPGWFWSKGDRKRLFNMILPRTVGLAAQQVNLLLVTIMGSMLTAGSIAVFHLANNVQHLPVGIFGIAFAQAAFPTLAEQMSRGKKEDFMGTLTRSFRYILFFVVPVSLFFFLLRAQMIRVLFGDGAFDWNDTILTYRTFGWLIISIFAQATIPLLVRAFYVQENTKTPVLISIGSMVINIVLAIGLARELGLIGLAIAFSVSSIVQLALLLGVLHWQLGGFRDREVLSGIARMALASLAGGAVLQMLKLPVAHLVDMQRFWGVLTQLLVAGVGGVVVYILVMWLLKSDELKALQKYLPKRFKMGLIGSGDTPRFEGLE